MTNIEAAIGLAPLEKVEDHIAARHRVADWYYESLGEMAHYLTPQKQTPGAEGVWWMYSVGLTRNSKISRDTLIRAFAADGIETRSLLFPMHIMPAYYDEQAYCPVGGILLLGGSICLPMYEALTKEDVAYICSQLKSHISA